MDFEYLRLFTYTRIANNLTYDLWLQHTETMN